MRITRVAATREDFGLTRPYTIAFDTTDSVENVIVRVETDSGATGWGAASPAPHVTGETLDACAAALSEEGLGWLVGVHAIAACGDPVAAQGQRRVAAARGASA